MMQVRHKKSFTKQYKKLSPKIQRKARETVKILRKDYHDKRLRNHGLVGSMKGTRAISVTGDVRIIFIEENNYKKVTLLYIGTHSQVYK